MSMFNDKENIEKDWLSVERGGGLLNVVIGETMDGWLYLSLSWEE